jgi:hypothetical protein
MKLNEEFKVLKLEEVNNPSTDLFITQYEEKDCPVLIKNYPLKWKAFNWDLKVIAEKLGHKGFDKYVDYPVDNKNYKGPDEGCYLKDYKLSKSDLQNDYSIPKLFSDAKYQPGRWQWLYWGSASTTTSMHLDTDGSHAWLVPIIGYKYFWIYYKNKCLHAIISPGDILYTPKNTWHAFVNLTSCLAITHNYKRKVETPGLDIVKKFIAQIKL